nr:MAG TPA: hypothetical protein [Caudoviricetes sp.]
MILTFDSRLAKRYGINIAVIYSVFIDYITLCINEDFMFSTNGKNIYKNTNFLYFQSL